MRTRSFLLIMIVGICTFNLYAQDEGVTTAIPIPERKSLSPYSILADSPLDPDVQPLPERARRGGVSQCLPGQREEYGRSVYALLRLVGDSLGNWIIEHQLCDTLVGGREPNELLLYRGEPDSIAPSSAGVRIGPDEVGSFTQFLTAADFDQDGYLDLLCYVEIIGDTMFANTNYQIGYPIVYWGSKSRRYSTTDTSHLAGESDAWLGVFGAGVLDYHKDSMVLCLVSNTYDYYGHDSIGKGPGIRIFTLKRGERWGRSGVPNHAVWRLWNRPRVDFRGGTSILDHDGDGALDLALHFPGDEFGRNATVSVLYGRKNNLPDSNQLQSVRMDSANGRWGLFTDITGDGIPELVAHGGNDEVLRIFIGLRGQRLLEQYGSGKDPERPGEQQWWGRPWATLRLPRIFWTGWPSSVRQVIPLGDGNGDGIDDLWIMSADRYLLCYTTGEWLDDYVDGIHDLRAGDWFYPADYPETYAIGQNLDGRGGTLKIVGTTSGVHYLGENRSLPRAQQRIHRLPAGTGRPTTAVPEELPTTGPRRLDLRYR